MSEPKKLNWDEVFDQEKAVLKDRHDGEHNIGIACSGGGIRSATFNLGILTVLEKFGLVDKADYLSTVSGGGYVGSYLISNRMKNHRLDRDAKTDGALKHLRSYSNYLTPSVGVMSTDTWTMMMVWFRNTSMLQLFLLSVFGALLLLPRLWTWAVQAWVRDTWVPAVGTALAILIFHAMVALICDGLIRAHGPIPEEKKSTRSELRYQLSGVVLMAIIGCAVFVIGAFDSFRQPDFLKTGLVTHFGLTLGFCGFFLALYSLGYGRGYQKGGSVAFRRAYWIVWTLAATNFCSQLDLSLALAANSILTAAAVFIGQKKIFQLEDTEAETDLGRSLGAGLACAVASVASIYTASLWLGDWALRAHQVLEENSKNPLASKDIWEYALFATPGLLATLGCCIIVMIGVAGRAMPDLVREGWSRLGALLYMKSLLLLVVGVVGVFGPLWVLEAWSGWHSYVIASGGVATALIGAASVILANSGDTNGKEQKSPWKEKLVGLAPVAFVALVFCVVAVSLHFAFVDTALSGKPAAASPCVVPAEAEFVHTPPLGLSPPPSAAKPRVAFALCGSNLPAVWQGPDWPLPKDLIRFHWQFLQASITTQFKLLGGLLLGLLALAVILASRLDINEYSINRFYRNRLTRCFIGASRARTGERKPDSITGFDLRDDTEFEMSAVATFLREDKSKTTPIPILNTALNAVGGADAALQERRARSYFFTPFHGYSDSTQGHRIEDLSTGRRTGEVPLGSLVAISGAAANPNMGFHTSPAVAFLLTFFNVRLGWWLGVPGRLDEYKRRFNLAYIFFELFGTADEDDAYVNLSDGGHFENLGIYELVRRKCKLIIVGDGEQDNDYVFESLGMAIRRCRIDFGAEIDINVKAIQPAEKGGVNGRNWAVGKIVYDDKSIGYLLYLKSSFTGDEPYDVQQYRFKNTDFPQQSTGDQFFDESQFESYRQLGLFAAGKLMDAAGAPPEGFAARKGWYDAARKLYNLQLPTGKP